MTDTTPPSTSNESPLQILTSNPETWLKTSLISVTQLTPSAISLLLLTTQTMKTLVRTHGGDNRCAHKILGTLFYEASTRTSLSFQTAMQRLGGSVVHIDAGKGGNSSAKKGESLSDTVRCVGCYADVVALRHGDVGSVRTVVETLGKGGCGKEGGGGGVPVLNAGDGVGEHPTQALLDLFTILEELGLLDQSIGLLNKTNGLASERSEGKQQPLVIVLLGDLKHGRTVHSLAKLLSRCAVGIHAPIVLKYCSPPGLEMPQSVVDYVTEQGGVTQEVVSDELKTVVQDANVLYVTRIQKERFESVEEYEKVKGKYVVNAELLTHAPQTIPGTPNKNSFVVMHPLPRVDEISTDIDQDPRAAYFRQMENGMFVRMALLALVLGKA